MHVDITRNALDKVPLSLIIDDSTALVNLNYFFNRDLYEYRGDERRWETMPVVIPESFTREWGEWCGENGVKGKYSIVPNPAGLGRLDQGLALFGDKQLESWLDMCREVFPPNFDITPEMLTHTYVLDPKTMERLDPPIWEQIQWPTLPEDQEELVTDYIAVSCEILVNIGLTPQGVTSPGGFGSKTRPFYAKCAGNAVRRVTDNPIPYFFQQIHHEPPVPTPVWYPDREAGTATGEIVACTGDWTGSWTGYDEVSVDKYITSDLQGGRLPSIINAGDPAVLISHWQGFYGMHNDDRRGFNTLKAVVKRLKERDPDGEQTRWLKPSQITRYAIAKEMSEMTVDDASGEIKLDLPVLTPELTLSVRGKAVRGVRVDGADLKQASGRKSFSSGSYLQEGDRTLIAFDPEQRSCTIELIQG